MALTDVLLRNSKPKDKAYKISDSAGLYIYIQTNGTKSFRYDYRFAGKRKTLTIGNYPLVSLSGARTLRDEAKRQLLKNLDPSTQKKIEKISLVNAQENTFANVARRFLESRKDIIAKPTFEKSEWVLFDIASSLSNRPISEITPHEILELLKRIEASGRIETAHRLKSTMSRVFSYAIANLLTATDPTYPLRGAIKAPKTKHQAAITNKADFGKLLCSIEEFDGWPSLRDGLLFLAYTAARPGEVRFMHWDEINLEDRKWVSPAHKRKMRRDHTIFLSTQAMDVLKEVRTYSDSKGLVFPSLRSSTVPISENGFNATLRRLGYTKEEHCSH